MLTLSLRLHFESFYINPVELGSRRNPNWAGQSGEGYVCQLSSKSDKEISLSAPEGNSTGEEGEGGLANQLKPLWKLNYAFGHKYSD